MFKALFDKTDITEVRRHEDRLRKRLEKLGFRLTKGETVKRSSHLKQLKHELRSRGYKITNILTGDVECGGKYDLRKINEISNFLPSKTPNLLFALKLDVLRHENGRKCVSKRIYIEI